MVKSECGCRQRDPAPLCLTKALRRPWGRSKCLQHRPACRTAVRGGPARNKRISRTKMAWCRVLACLAARREAAVGPATRGLLAAGWAGCYLGYARQIFGRACACDRAFWAGQCWSALCGRNAAASTQLLTMYA